MRIKTAIAWTMVLMLVISAVGCSQPAAEETEVTDVIPEITAEPTATPEPTPVPTTTPLPERGQLEGADVLAAALAELGYDDIDLTKNYTNEELIAFIVKVLGKEKQAEKNNYQHPFEDVSDELSPYVGYAYANWLLTNVPNNELGAQEEADDALLNAMLLRALGYKDYGEEPDFTAENMQELVKELGISEEDSEYPVRGDDIVDRLWTALNTEMKGDDETLMDRLEEDDVFSSRDVRHAREVIEEAEEAKEQAENPDREDDSDDRHTESESVKKDEETSEEDSSSGGSNKDDDDDDHHSGGSSGGGNNTGGGNNNTGGGNKDDDDDNDDNTGGGNNNTGGDNNDNDDDDDNTGGGDTGGDSGSSSGGGAGGENETPTIPFG